MSDENDGAANSGYSDAQVLDVVKFGPAAVEAHDVSPDGADSAMETHDGTSDGDDSGKSSREVIKGTTAEVAAHVERIIKRLESPQLKIVQFDDNVEMFTFGEKLQSGVLVKGGSRQLFQSTMALFTLERDIAMLSVDLPRLRNGHSLKFPLTQAHVTR